MHAPRPHPRQVPSGDKIWYKNRQASGGKLDVDANNEAGKEMEKPVENICFAERPEPGLHKVEVNNYKKRSGVSEPTKFTLSVEIGGATYSFEGEVDNEETMHAASIQVQRAGENHIVVAGGGAKAVR